MSSDRHSNKNRLDSFSLFLSCPSFSPPFAQQLLDIYESLSKSKLECTRLLIVRNSRSGCIYAIILHLGGGKNFSNFQNFKILCTVLLMQITQFSFIFFLHSSLFSTPHKFFATRIYF